MKIRKALILFWATVISTYFLAFPIQGSAATAPDPNVCYGGQYSVRFDGKSAGTAGTVVWKYTINANQTALSAVKNVVLVVPRPVTPQNILSATPLPFCVPSDNNTKINTGNCGGFPINNLPLTPTSSTTLTTQIVTSANVTQGLVTMNVVTGASSSTVCVNNDDPDPKGIPGPGDIGDPFQPLTKTESVVAAGGKCSVQLNYDSSGKLISLSNPVSTNPSDTSIQCQVANPNSVLVNNELLRNNTGRSGITFGNGTTTCYGPPVPSTPWCVCTKAPCP
jgi:hypothetical protein